MKKYAVSDDIEQQLAWLTKRTGHRTRKACLAWCVRATRAHYVRTDKALAKERTT